MQADADSLPIRGMPYYCSSREFVGSFHFRVRKTTGPVGQASEGGENGNSGGRCQFGERPELNEFGALDFEHGLEVRLVS